VVLAALALLVVVAAVALALSSRDDGGDGDLAEGTTPSSTAPPDPGTTPSNADPEALDDLAVTYLETLAAGDLDAAFAMLSPAMQGSQPRSSFDAFWGGLDSIEIVGEPRVDPGDAAVTVPVTFDGGREDYRLTFVRGDDGTWLVDGPRPG
jgi:eukaryotic-like serine/threonine-protein kinase